MAEAVPLVAYPDLDSRVRALETDGYVYFPGVLSADDVASLRAQMDKLEPIQESFDKHWPPEDGGHLNKPINNAFNRHVHFLRFLDMPEVVEVADAVHGDECHVIGMTAWLTGPGRPDQTLHVDWQPLDLPEDIMTDPRVKVPVFITTAYFYLNDMYEELGPTKFVPGSHRAGRPPNGDASWNGIGEKSVICKAGDVVTFRSEVWHRGSSNSSDETRYLLQVHYANRMITQKFPPYLNRFQFDAAILSQATPRQRRLLGDHKQGNYD